MMEHLKFLIITAFLFRIVVLISAYRVVSLAAGVFGVLRTVTKNILILLTVVIFKRTKLYASASCPFFLTKYFIRCNIYSLFVRSVFEKALTARIKNSNVKFWELVHFSVMAILSNFLPTINYIN